MPCLIVYNFQYLDHKQYVYNFYSHIGQIIFNFQAI